MWLAERWQLPVYITQTMGYHHLPLECPDFPKCAAAVHVADIIIRTIKIGNGGDNRVPPLDERAWGLLGAEPEEIRGIATDTRIELKKAGAFLALLQ